MILEIIYAMQKVTYTMQKTNYAMQARLGGKANAPLAEVDVELVHLEGLHRDSIRRHDGDRVTLEHQAEVGQGADVDDADAVRLPLLHGRVVPLAPCIQAPLP